MTPNFIYVCDAPFAAYVRLGLKAIRTFYPDAAVYIYDLSDKPSDELRDLHRNDSRVFIHHHPPSEWVEPAIASKVDFAYFHPNLSVADRLNRVARQLRFLATGKAKASWKLDTAAFVESRRRFIRIIAQKPFCISHCLANTDGPLLFLDADAFLCAPLKDMELWSCDAAVTVRRLSEIQVGLDPGVACSRSIPYHAVNAGVIYFANTVAARHLAASWLEETLKFDYFMVEQTALSAMLLEDDPHAFATYFRTIRVGDASVLTLPCEIYNNTYCHPEHDEIPADACVVHYKGGHKQEQFMAVISSRVCQRLAAGRS